MQAKTRFCGLWSMNSAAPSHNPLGRPQSMPKAYGRLTKSSWQFKSSANCRESVKTPPTSPLLSAPTSHHPAKGCSICSGRCAPLDYAICALISCRIDWNCARIFMQAAASDKRLVLWTKQNFDPSTTVRNTTTAIDHGMQWPDK